MKPIDLKLRGYIQREQDSSCLAVCIDLNLVAQGDTPKEARNKLHEIINDYLLEAFTEDKQYFDDLVPRKPPFIFLLRYYWLVFLSRLHFASSALFTEHLPLIPASQAHGR